MAATETASRASAGQDDPARLPLPDPGEPVPALAWPTLGLFFGSLTLWGLATWAVLGDYAPLWVTVPVHAVVTFVMFTVVHDATHYSISTRRWVNGLIGRLAMPFVSIAASFPLVGWIHIEHHRHANDDERDPDTYASHAPWWQLPFRWVTTDLWYGRIYLSKLRTRPAAEVAESAAMVVLTVAGISLAAATGNLWTVAAIYLIPNRIGMGVLVWWFDWLPHHGLPETQRENRYRATRLRVGMEWLYTPLMLSQNYHLVHHLHPSIPFYRYVRTWRRNEEAYLERNAAITTVYGQQLSPEQYRVWKELDSAIARMRKVEVPPGSSASHAVFHEVPVAAVDRLTDDSVLITFAVPEALADEFRFTQGQHLTVRTNLGGEGVRRNYSICSPATAPTLRIAVKHIEDGAFSTFAMNELRAGDTLELMTPTGRFSTDLDPLNAKHYVAICAGSGITPVLSLLATALEVETESRFTLIYGNRTKDSTMFRHELDHLLARFADRLEVHHVRSREGHRDPLQSGRVDRNKLERWLSTTLAPDTVDEWFMCGPIEMVEAARDTLVGHGVDSEQIHLELFFGYKDGDGTAPEHEGAGPCALTFRLGGAEESAELAPGETILEAALQVRDDAPYACMGGACGTCKAKLVEGTVAMDHNFALGAEDVAAGYVLTCQSHPTSDAVTVDYDG